MAKAYLGKISAIVTANTSDFNSKLNASAKEVRSFAASMQSTLNTASSAAQASLRGIYTESQKVSRALQAAASQRLSFKGFDTSSFASLSQAVDQFKRIQQAAVSVNEPLSEAARTVERLSASVQISFDPAMKSAQKSAEYLNAALSRGGIVGEKSFERIRLKAEQAAQAADRLAEASQIASSGPRGTELAFQDPRLRDSLTASADLRRRAQNASAGVLGDGNVGRLVQQLRNLDEVAVRTRAEIESQKVLNVDTSAAEKRLRDILETSRRTGAALQGALNSEEIEASIGQFSRRATPVGNLLRQRQEDERRRRDEEIEASVGQFSRRATPVGDLLRQRQEDEQRRRDAEIEASVGQFSRRASSINPPENLERDARSRTGGDIPGGSGPLGDRLETGRQVDNVINRVAALRQQIDSLPDSIRSQFIPSLQRATDEAAALGSRGFAATAAQIRNAANEARRLEQGVARAQRGQGFSSQFGAEGRRGVEFGLQEQSLRGYTAQLQVLQQVLSGVSTTARGPATGAFDRLRTAISQAAADGTLDLRGTRQEIERLTREAVGAAAGVAQINPAGLGRRLQRAGDIGRGAFGNLGLGIQQAVFAFDDFFSVTGGLDQRIRAAGNNISQLGFVLGGTAGLITGVAVSITAQLVVALIKWQNAGVGTEDRLKSLNDALSKQKSLVEDLANAFKTIADEIARIGFSKAGADAAQFQRQLDDIRKKQREFNQERFAELDPDVQRERGVIASREARLAKEEDPATRLRLQEEINDARRREAEAATRARGAAPITAAEAARVAVEARRAREVQIAREIESPNEEAGANNRARQRQEDIDQRLGAASGEQERREIARDQLLFEKNRLEREARSNDFFGADILGGGSSNSEQLAAVNLAIRQLDQSIVDAANRLEVETASAAIGAAKQIGLAQAKVADAIEAGVPGAVGLQVQLDGLTQQLFDAQSELAAAQARARGPGGTGADLGAATKARDEVARIQDSINQRDGEIKAIEASRRALELFATAFEKVRQEAESNLQAAESARDQARGDDLERGTAGSRQGLDRAQSDLDRQTEARNRVRRETARAEEEARQDEGVRRREEEIARIDSQLSSSGVLAPGQRDGLIARREELRQQNESSVQNAVNNDPGVATARDQSTAEERRRQSAERGRQASQTSAQKAGEELANTLRDIRANFEAQPGGAAGNAAAAADASRRAAQDAMRQTAPAIFGMADAVQNAVLQGPSRAALQASDVTTMQGASELNRLIRGDDSAKNVDTVELQKQSKALEQLVAIAQANGAPPAVFN
jgi:hypothetical protein